MTKEASMNHRVSRINGPRNNRMESVQDCLGLMEHLSSCDSVRCGVRSCFRLKKAVQHAKECKRKGQCTLCKQVIRICVLHAKNCLVTNCKVYFCGMIRMRLSLRQEVSKSQGSKVNKGQERRPLTVSTIGHGVQPPSDTSKDVRLHCDMSPLQRSFSVFTTNSVNNANMIMELQRSTSYDQISTPEIIGSGLLQDIGTQGGASSSSNDLVSTYEKMDITNY